MKTSPTALSALSSAGPYTVFAPVNAAFAKIPEETLNGLLADVPQLTNVLLFHVVPGKLGAADLSNGQVLQTALSGNTLTVRTSGAEVWLESSYAPRVMYKVLATDIMASNGIVHTIDTVLLPFKAAATTTTLMSAAVTPVCRIAVNAE